MPAPYRLLIKGSAEKELRALPRGDLKRVVRRIGQLSAQPRPPGCEKLAVGEGYRVRQGDYRIVNLIDDAQAIVEIVKIGHRREVYR